MRSIHRHHAAALATITAAVALDAGLGTWFGAADHIGVPDGLFFATTTATTVGYGDLTAHGWLPHILAVIMMLTVIPLFAATFSLLTSGLAGQDARARLSAAEQRIKDHTEARLRHHLNAQPPAPVASDPVPAVKPARRRTASGRFAPESREAAERLRNPGGGGGP